MNYLKNIGFYLLIIFLLAGAAEKAIAQPAKKKTAKGVQAHRGTILLDVHAKVNRQAHLRYAAFPKMDSLVAELPAGAEIVTADSVNFYYYKKGVYYVQQPKGIYVIAPLPGIRLHGLPIGYRRIAIGDKLYFYYFGTFYQQVGNSEDYEVIIAPETAIVEAIPNGYKIKKVENIEYYFLGGVYYAEIDDPRMEDKVGYEVVTIIEAY